MVINWRLENLRHPVNFFLGPYLKNLTMLPAQRNTSKKIYPAAEQAKLQVIIDSITDDMSFQEQMAKLLEA